MKRSIKKIAILLTVLTFIGSSCKKDDKDPEPAPEPTGPQVNDPEVITTFRLYIWDSITNAAVAGSPFSFKDPDGDGGVAGGFLNNGADSVIALNANTTYRTRIVILDETKNPVDSTSNDIAGDESYEHMFFYNGDPSETGNKGNTIIKAGSPDYTIRLNSSNARLRYSDMDNGSSNGQPARNIGLETYLQTSSSFAGKFPFITTLRHQPGVKNGTYAPGETDISIEFKIKVN